nr:Uma2 family endonuclease [Romeria gracilis]
MRSASDTLSDVQVKMQDYLENGLRLGWLINPQNRQVEVYGLGQAVKVLDSPTELSAEPVLPGFAMSLRQIL